MHFNNNLSNKHRQSTFKIKGIFFNLMTLLRNGYQHDKLIDGCFNRNLEIHVSSSLSNKQLYSAFPQTKTFLLILMTSSCKRHQHDYSLIDGCFHKNLEIHVSNCLPTEEVSIQTNYCENFYSDKAITQ